MSLSKHKEQLLCKVEVTDGTYTLGSPTGAEFMPDCLDIDIDPDWDQRARRVARQTLNKAKKVVGGKKGRITFSMNLKGNTAAGTAPVQSPIWRSLGFAETISAGVSVTYKRSATDAVGFSYAVWLDGVIYGLKGCRADATFNHVAGEPIVAEVTVEGVWVTPVDGSSVTPPADTIEPEPFLGAGLTFWGEDLCFETFTLEMGNEIIIPKCANDSAAYKYARRVDAEPTGSLDPEQVLLATLDIWDKWSTKEEDTLTYSIGATAGNILTFSGNAALDGVDSADRESIRTWASDLEFVADADAAEGDDYSFVWT
ncbi:MAG: hypothetical protein GY716_10305 [bacterium]|nr:hypothetical protein [bacterium]